MEKYQNKYRIPSARWQDWDYAWDGAYFITICTQNREHYFGEIIENKMVLSNSGTIADILWYEIKNHAKNIELDEFVVMPNHIHGILILRGNVADNGMPCLYKMTTNYHPDKNDSKIRVKTPFHLSWVRTNLL
jgi:putative transposase